MRGLPFSDGRVSQLLLRANYNATNGAFAKNDQFAVLAFINYDPDKREVDGAYRSVVDEFDFMGQYTLPSADSAITATARIVNEWLYHQQYDRSSEIALELNAPKLPIVPTFTAVKDFENGKGTYFALSASYTQPLGFVDMTLTGEIAYNDGYWTDFSGFSHYGINAALSKTFDDVTISASYLGTRKLSEGIKNFSLGQASIIVGF
jgi:hypothetical protein